MPLASVEPFVFPVTNADNRVKGTAFFLTHSGHAVTAWHVLRLCGDKAFLHLPAAKSTEGASDAPGTTRFEIELKKHDENLDLAVFTVPCNVSRTLELSIRANIGDEVSSHGFSHEHSVLTFPRGYPLGPTPLGGLTTVQVKADGPSVRLWVIPFDGVNRGLSGAPVVNAESERIIGILRLKYESASTPDAFAIPAVEISRLVPELTLSMRASTSRFKTPAASGADDPLFILDIERSRFRVMEPEITKPLVSAPRAARHTLSSERPGARSDSETSVLGPILPKPVQSFLDDRRREGGFRCRLRCPARELEEWQLVRHRDAPLATSTDVPMTFLSAIDYPPLRSVITGRLPLRMATVFACPKATSDAIAAAMESAYSTQASVIDDLAIKSLVSQASVDPCTPEKLFTTMRPLPALLHVLACVEDGRLLMDDRRSGSLSLPELADIVSEVPVVVLDLFARHASQDLHDGLCAPLHERSSAAVIVSLRESGDGSADWYGTFYATLFETQEVDRAVNAARKSLALRHARWETLAVSLRRPRDHVLQVEHTTQGHSIARPAFAGLGVSASPLRPAHRVILKELSGLLFDYGLGACRGVQVIGPRDSEKTSLVSRSLLRNRALADGAILIRCNECASFDSLCEALNRDLDLLASAEIDLAALEPATCARWLCDNYFNPRRWFLVLDRFESWLRAGSYTVQHSDLDTFIRTALDLSAGMGKLVFVSRRAFWTSRRRQRPDLRTVSVIRGNGGH